eukprot:SAG31_NODE_230_length_19771_cov_90.041739_16_plen_152_part_00
MPVWSTHQMLHFGILPNHRLWEKMLKNLTFVVIDEAHTYRGVFGSQMALLMRRLLRLCRHYGSEPQFILLSATIANPKELATKLIGAEVNDAHNTPDSMPWCCREWEIVCWRFRQNWSIVPETVRPQGSGHFCCGILHYLMPTGHDGGQQQ